MIVQPECTEYHETPAYIVYANPDIFASAVHLEKGA